MHGGNAPPLVVPATSTLHVELHPGFAGFDVEIDGHDQAATQIDFWDRYVSTREFTQLKGWELQNLLLIARLMCAAATARTESRGAHQRDPLDSASGISMGGSACGSTTASVRVVS